MATERQIAANRRNARKSTGPRSQAGKKRVSRNAYRHGLSVSLTSNSELAEQLEELACKLAAAGVRMEYARIIAHAELDLARVWRVKEDLIAPVLARGVTAEKYTGPNIGRQTRRADPTPAMHGRKSDHSAEASRWLVADLLKLDRYERRASAMRDRALRHAIVGLEPSNSLS